MMPWTFLTNHAQVLLAIAAEPKLARWQRWSAGVRRRLRWK
jgi:hypothetical protein